MKENEKKLLFELCRVNCEDKSTLVNLINDGNITAEVLGHLLWNRMIGVAYENLKELPYDITINREFKTSIKDMTFHYIDRNNDYFECIKYLNSILKTYEKEFVMLKGAYLCQIYTPGGRIANDVDLLVKEKSLDDIGNCLKNHGFIQGYIKNDCLVPATREEIIYSRMMKGETVPYVKEVNLKTLKWLEVDINFSLDYKPGDSDVVNRIVDQGEYTKNVEVSIRVPHKFDFIIHLCQHLYKEATTLPWINMKRDMTLYKFIDIGVMIDLLSLDELTLLCKRIIELDAQISCYYAIYCYNQLLGGNEKTNRIIELLDLDNTSFIHKVIAPSEHKMYIYKEKNIANRFWHANRKELLIDI